MVSADQSEFRKHLAELFGAYGRREPDTATLAAWWTALREFYLSDIDRAMKRVIGEVKTLPTPAHVIGIIRDKHAAGRAGADGNARRCSQPGCESEAHAGQHCVTHSYALHPQLHPTYVLLARRMIAEGKREIVLRDPTMGQRYLDWVETHPEGPRAPAKPTGARAFAPTAAAPRRIAESLPEMPPPGAEDYLGYDAAGEGW